MSLNIKNEETCQLARELAGLTGVSLTAAITLALQEKLERFRRERGTNRVERLLSIGRECALHLDEAALRADHGELLYDERGLPK